MRRMRVYLIWVVPLCVLGVGIWFSFPELFSGSQKTQKTADASKAKPRNIDFGSEEDSDREAAAESKKKPVEISEAKAKAHEKTAHNKDEGVAVEVADHAGAPEHLASTEKSDRGKTLTDRAPSAEDKSLADQCSSLEYRGDGLEKTLVSAEQKEQIMDDFHAAKANLLGWIKKNRKSFSDATYEKLTRQINATLIQFPPVREEPDLAWRGVGVWYQTPNETDEGGATIRLGSGFLKLIRHDPVRGRFELTRLVAQSWAPCELQRVSTADIWKPLLSCLGANEPGCGPGTVSEAGWAVSTAIAAAVSPPGCTIPAFADKNQANCLKDFIASHGLGTDKLPKHVKAQREWKEAQR